MSNITVMPTSPRDQDTLTVIGARLARTREALGRTQEQFAQELGVSRSAVAGWENGTRLPDVLAMVRLKARHNVPTDWVFAGTPAGLPYDLAARLLGHQPNPPAARRKGA